VAAKINASGKKANQTGGTVKILGENIQLQAPTSIDVSGYNGGGIIDIGGDFHGAGPDFNALTTIVDNGVTINANALMNGNGGNVAVWSNADTEFHGSISAQGGIASGNGGFVETSGHYLSVLGASINTLAPSGSTGMWLLDPTDVTISGSATSNETLSGGTYTPATNSANILASELTTALASSNISVITTSTGSANGDIAVNAALTWSSANTLSLTAARNIYINSDITATNGGLTLSAVNGSQSITGGTIGSGTLGGTVGTLTANISVKNLTLSQGQWFQSAGSLPTLSVSNNFQISSGSTYDGKFAAQFTRINTTSGNGITDVFGLQGIATGPLNASYVLSNNIDATVTSNWNSGKGFFPIGTGNFPTPANPFTGTFNGEGFTINNLFMNNNISNEGLFGYAKSETISNVGITNATVKGSSGGLGILVGFNDSGIISGSYTTGSAGSSSDTSNVYGGLVGSNNGDINNSYSTASVQTNNDYVGGLVGINGNNGNGTIEISFSAGTVIDSSGHQSVGGLVGAMNNTSSISNSYSTSPVTGYSRVGGLVGNVIVSASTVSDSYSTGYITLLTGGSFVGGVIGFDGGSSNVTNIYWNAKTSGQLSSSGGGTGLTTAQLQSALQTGFSSSTWGIIAGNGTSENGSYPYLKAIYTSTPRVISGYIPNGSATANNLNGFSVVLNYNGSVIDTVSTGKTGFYYFLEPNGRVADSNPFLVYMNSGSTKANVVGLAPVSGASAVLLNMASDVINVYGNTTAITNSNLITAAGSSPSTNVLYSGSGANLVLGNTTNTTATLQTNTTTMNHAGTISTAATTYTIDGMISVNSGSSPNTNVNLSSGPVNLNSSSVVTAGSQNYGSSSKSVTLGASNISLDTTNGGANPSGGSMTLGPITSNGDALTLNAGTGGDIFSYGFSGGGNLTLTNSDSVTFNRAVNAGIVTLTNSASYFIFDNVLTANTLTTAANNYGLFLYEGSTITNAVTLLNTGGRYLTGTNTFTGGLTSTGSTTTINGSVNTAANTLSLGSISLAADSTLDTTNNGGSPAGGNITVGTITSGGNALTLNAGTAGMISGSSFSGGGDLTLTNSAGATFSGAINAGTVTLANITGSITFNGALTANTLITAAAGYNLLLNNGSSITSDAVTLSNTGGVSLIGTNTFTGGLTSTTSTNTINGSVVTEANTLSLGAVILSGTSTLDTTDSGSYSAGNNITVGAIASGGHAVTLNAGTAGTISGSSFAGGGNLTLTNSAGTTFSGLVSAETVTLLNTTGSIALNGGLSASFLVTADQGYNLTIGSGGTISSAGVTNFLNTGTLTLGSSGGSMTINGGFTTIGNASNPSSVILNGTISTVNNNATLGAMSLGSDTTLSTGSGAVSVGGTIDGGFDLTLTGHAITLQGVIGGSTPLASITTNGSATINSGSVTTSGNQTYNNTLTMGATNNTFTSTGNNTTITINGISGNNLTLAGGTGSNNYVLNGNLTLNNLTVNGGSGSSNALTVNTNDNTQNWSINSSNSGSISGINEMSGSFNFNGIQTLNGNSNSANNFIFTSNGSIDSIVGSSSAVNTLNFNGYGSGVTLNVSAASPFAGSIINNALQTIASYFNMNNVTGQNLSAVLPNKTMMVNITGGQTGTIADPFNFTGVSTIYGNSLTTITFASGLNISYNPGTNVLTVNGLPMTLVEIPSSTISLNFSTQLVSYLVAANASVAYQSTATNYNSVNNNTYANSNIDSISPAAGLVTVVQQSLAVTQDINQMMQLLPVQTTEITVH